MYGKPTSTRARPSQDYQSPNMFAQGDDFRPWQLAARVVVSPPVASTVRDLCQQLLEFRLPLSLLTTLVLEGQRRFFEALDGWRQHNPSLICSDDPHRMSSYWVMLCCIYQSLNDVGSETAQRRGVHEIVDLVFTLSLGSKFKTRFDERIHLCKVANPVSVTPKPIMTADTLVTTEHSAQSLHDIGVELVALQVTLSQDMLRQLEWGERRDEFSLIMFAGEFKTVTTSSNMSNLVMDLTTAQYHRRALKLKDRVVFGGTYSSGILEVYSSSWDENWVRSTFPAVSNGIASPAFVFAVAHPSRTYVSRAPSYRLARILLILVQLAKQSGYMG
ncbi:hypothetical protein JAAARDRAFT_625073 [Jaapia argillacea MUCL 33604]|uniref:Uncharacterized protein n=1 Tax=Jaapia argillacea MUCL 33604 TaxID=933084 RepID=A0A067PXJ8_9AGAM|nr:hypothetical protein JAAARDRAFT_625073 [Jaapia argillacea MUCL 33604]